MAKNLPKSTLIHEVIADEVITLDGAKLDKTTGIPSEIVASTEQTVLADTDIIPIVETTTLKKTLCRSCHSKTGARRTMWQEYFITTARQEKNNV